MRRTYISPEFHTNKVWGTFNMVEESNFFSAKMLEIEDFIDIENQDIIYYQKDNGEQIDLSIESSLPSTIFSSSDSKKENHTLIIDKSQSEFQLNRNTRWILEINLDKILEDFLYATMKKFRTFEGLKNNMTLEKDINVALRKYITKNVKDRYKLSSVKFLINYTDLRSQSLLKFKNIWNKNLTIEYQLKKIQTETSFDNSKIKILFEQEKPSQTYNFEYYFNLSFEKI